MGSKFPQPRPQEAAPGTKIIELGTFTKDSATGLKGLLTNYQISQNGRWYNFQPCGLNRETQQPIDTFWLAPDRLDATPNYEINLPVEVIGTEVEDIATGFKGTATAIVLHMTGCVHVEVQPAGRVAKTGCAIASANFDIRRLRGKAIKTMTRAERVADQQARPSPTPAQTFVPKPI